jgi:hypothetical protein
MKAAGAQLLWRQAQNWVDFTPGYILSGRDETVSESFSEIRFRRFAALYMTNKNEIERQLPSTADATNE